VRWVVNMKLFGFVDASGAPALPCLADGRD
jgi:hypothetical protein